MGIGSSVPLKNDLKRKTLRTSELIQRILGWMLKESNLLDYYALASPTECKQYVMFTADNLDTLFKDIQVTPLKDNKDNKGRIYFRKSSELSKMPDEIEKQRTENCYQIAYFFIRILQVFSALALSVIDTEIPSSFTILTEQAARKKDEKYVSPEEFKTIPLFGAKQQSQRSFFGGSIAPSSRLYIKDQNYSILNRYFTSEGGGYLRLFDDETDTGIILSEDSLLKNRYALIYRGTNTLGKKIEVLAYLTIKYNKKSDTEEEYLVKLDRFHINNESYPYESVEHTFRGLIGTDPEFKLQKIPRFIKNEFIRFLGKPLSSNASNVKTIKSAEELPRDINPRFQVKEIWKALGQKPPIKAHCVARALQLLSPEAIYDSSLKQAARTSICNTKFALQDTESLPKSDKSITSSASLLSLNLLFFDVLEQTVPSIKNKQEYKDFLNFMRGLFEERTAPADLELRDIYKNIDEIRETRNPILCSGKSGPLYTKDPRVVSTLRSKVSQLLERQIVHTANVVTILGQLFIIREGQPLLLQPAIQEGGIEAVNRVAESARKVLISYYGDCEKLYRDGVVEAAAQKNAFKEA
jgi:hypothetical protein